MDKQQYIISQYNTRLEYAVSLIKAQSYSLDLQQLCFINSILVATIKAIEARTQYTKFLVNESYTEQTFNELTY